VRPEEAQELVVRLDAGPLVVFSQRRPQRLEAGERVRLHLDGGMARVERDPAACAG
jgi:outer membrane lipoprotein SlyB